MNTAEKMEVTALPAIYVTEAKHPNDYIVTNAQNVFGKRYAIIPVSEIDIDLTYQRKPSPTNVRKLARVWNEDLADPIKVAYRDNRFKAFDGGHRLYAQMLNGRTEVQCQIYEKTTLEEEARTFLEQTKGITKLRPIDTLNANLFLGDEVDTAIVNLCKNEKYSVKIPETGNSYKAGELGSITGAREVVKDQGEPCLKWIFDVIKESGWNMMPAGYSGFNLRVLKNIYAQFCCTGREDKIKEILVNYFSLEPSMSPQYLKHVAVAKRPDLDARSAGYTFLTGIIRKKLRKN